MAGYVAFVVPMNSQYRRRARTVVEDILVGSSNPIVWCDLSSFALLGVFHELRQRAAFRWRQRSVYPLFSCHLLLPAVMKTSVWVSV